MWVKICGLTNPDDAQHALEAGADALGFIFVRQSPRYLPAHDPDWQSWLPTLQGATRVLVVSDPTELPDGWERCFEAVQWVVGSALTPDPSPTEWERGVGANGGSPSSSASPTGWERDVGANDGAPSDVLPLSRFAGEGSGVRAKSLWLALRFPPECTADAILQTLDALHAHAERFVLDTYHPTLLGGTGLTQDWARLREVCARAPRPILLAGGLTPENVADAIRTARPAGVDVSSGVEAAPGRKDPAKVRAFIGNAKTALEGERG
jgi:phosphoribosylanthranilate isomerase